MSERAAKRIERAALLDPFLPVARRARRALWWCVFLATLALGLAGCAVAIFARYDIAAINVGLFVVLVWIGVANARLERSARRFSAEIKP